MYRKTLAFLLSILMLLSAVSCGALPKEAASDGNTVAPIENLQTLAASAPAKMSETAMDDAYVRSGEHGEKCYYDE